MTAKEKLRDIVEEISEADAAEMLDYVVAHRRRERDALTLSPKPIPEVARRPPEPRPRRGRLAAIYTIPAWLFVGLFLSVYLAMAIVIVVVMVRG